MAFGWRAVVASVACAAAVAFACSDYGSNDESGPPPTADAGTALDAAVDDAAPIDGGAFVPSCDGGYCDCDHDAANGLEKLVMGDDPDNCGACGRACPAPCAGCSRSCAGGVCPPRAVATGQRYPREIFADDDGVYWATWSTDGGIVQLRDGGPAELFVRDPDAGLAARMIGMDAQYVYAGGESLLSDHGVFSRAPRCPAPPCAEEPIADTGGGVVRGAVDDLNVFVDFYASLTDDDSVFRFEKATGNIATLEATVKGVSTLGQSGDQLFFNRLVPDGGSAVEIVRRPKGPCGSCTVHVADAAPFHVMTLDATTMFGANEDANASVSRVDLASGVVSTLATGQCFPGVFVVRDDALYWANRGHPLPDGSSGVCEASVWVMAKTGGCWGRSPCPIPIARNQESVFGLAVNSTTIYWTSLTSNGTVYAVPR